MSSFTVSSVSVFGEDPDLSNEGNLFSAMYFSISSLIGFSKYESDGSPSDTDGCAINIYDEHKIEEDDDYIDHPYKKMI